MCARGAKLERYSVSHGIGYRSSVTPVQVRRGRGRRHKASARAMGDYHMVLNGIVVVAMAHYFLYVKYREQLRFHARLRRSQSEDFPARAKRKQRRQVRSKAVLVSASVCEGAGI